MKMMILFFSLMIMLVMMCTVTNREEEIEQGDIFSDDFGKSSKNRWLDMEVWGFGVWQIQDGAFVSLDSSNLTQQIYSAAPKLDNAILNRDFTVLFQMKPIDGSSLLFSMNVRQDGWSQYKIEISREGVISIKKSVLGRLDETLFLSEPGQMALNIWQWLRLDVRGKDPLSIRLKIWSGELQEEPAVFNANASDPLSLKPTNMAVAINTIQDGGAYIIIRDFNITSVTKASSLWRWAELKTGSVSKNEMGNRAYEAFMKGDLHVSETILRSLMEEDSDGYRTFNNLAVLHGEADDFEKALQWIDKAYRIAPDDSIITHNLNWVWYGLCSGGLIGSGKETDFPGIFSRIDRKVYGEPTQARLRIGIFHTLFHSTDTPVDFRISVLNGSDREVWSAERTCPVPDGAYRFVEENLNLAKFEDGRYKIVVTLRDGKGETQSVQEGFEVIHNDYRALRKRYFSLSSDIQENLLQSKSDVKHDWANLEVELLSVEKGFRGHEQSGLFQLFRESIEEGLEMGEKRLVSLKKGKQPYYHQSGSFLRGYFSEIDGSVQGYAIFVPEKYNANEPFPLVVNLHGYDPSFSGWKENPFLPMFTPVMMEHSRYIVVSPFGRSNTFYQHIGENDVVHVLKEVRRLYNIDENRIYLTGGSMGGAGTWHIGLHFPDRFAAIAPIMGPTELGFWTGPGPEKITEVRRFILAKNSALSVAENASHLSMYCNHGVLDDIVPIEQSRKMVERLRRLDYDIQYVEHPEAQHGGFDPAMDRSIYDWFEDLRRDPHPRRVVFKTGDLKHSGAYWVKVDGFIDLLKFGTIEAEILASNTIHVKTDNVARFRLFFNDELFDLEKPVQIHGDDQTWYNGKIPADRRLALFADLTEEGIVGRWSTKNPREPMAPFKKNGLAGPIVDGVNSGFLLIYGSIGSVRETAINKSEAQMYRQQWKSWQHVPCRMKKDTDVTEEDIANYNIVLFGGPDCNLLTHRIHDDLPIRFQGETLLVGDQRFSGEHVGLAMIYPNPLNRNRYVVLQSGVSWKGTSGITKRIGSEFDYIVFDEHTMGINRLQGNMTIDGTPLLCGFFDQNWQISEDYQWQGDPKVRKAVVPRRLPEKGDLDNHGTEIYLSDGLPDKIDQATGLPEYDRNFWGDSFRVDGKKVKKGIGCFPHSILVYRPDGKWKTFSAILTADLNLHSGLKKENYQGGKIQFGVYGDGHELFVSRVMDVKSKSQKLNVPIEGIKELKLVVRTQDWLPTFAQSASWVDAKLLR